MNARLAEDVFLESEFFDRAEHMREQLSAALELPENGTFKHVSSPGAYSFLLASAAQVFRQELVLAFLNQLRRWAGERLAANHASTPQIHAYLDGQQRALAPDASQACWHYLFSVAGSGAADVRLLDGAEPRSARLGINLVPVTRLQLQFNQLLVHHISKSYAISCSKRTAILLDGAILLHGYLW